MTNKGIIEVVIDYTGSCRTCGNKLDSIKSWGNYCYSCLKKAHTKRSMEGAGISPDDNLKECYISVGVAVGKSYSPEAMEKYNNKIDIAPQKIVEWKERKQELEKKLPEARQAFYEAERPEHYRYYTNEGGFTFGFPMEGCEYVSRDFLSELMNMDTTPHEEYRKLERKFRSTKHKIRKAEKEIKSWRHWKEKSEIRPNVTDEMVEYILEEIDWDEETEETD